jgi:hypothetical protein
LRDAARCVAQPWCPAGAAPGALAASLPLDQARLAARFLAAGFLAGAFFFAAVVLVFAAALAMVVFPFSLQSESIFEPRPSCGIEAILLIEKTELGASSAVFRALCCVKSTKNQVSLI